MKPLKPKTMKTYIALVIGMVLTVGSTAQPKSEILSENQRVTPPSSLLEKQINKLVVYPLQMERKHEGVVEIDFFVDESGEIGIVRMNSNDPTLSTYVSEKISQIRLPKDDSSIGSIRTFRFVFKKESKSL